MRQSGHREQYRESGAEAGKRLNEMLAEGRSYSGRERNCCFLNTTADARSHGRFANISATSGLDLIDDARAIGLVDWDLDGDLDAWISNRNAPRLRLMRNDVNNESTSSNYHYVAFRLEGDGRTANRDAIGARVEVVTAGESDSSELRRRIQTLRAGEGFLAQSSKWILFGLGTADKIEKVIVHWPGGLQSDQKESSNQEVFEGVTVDRRYNLVQGSGVAKELSNASRNLALHAGVPNKLEHSNEARIPLQVLFPAPKLKYTGFDGRNREKSSHGKPIVVNLWSSSCRPCIEELGEFTKRADELQAAGINVLALSVDELTQSGNQEDAPRFIAQIGFPFDSGFATSSLVENLQNLYDELMPLHQSLPIPTSLLIDPKGRLSVIYKGRVSVNQLLDDKDHWSGTSLERFQRAAAVPGTMIRNELIDSAIVRLEAASHNLLARKLEKEGSMKEAAAQYREVIKRKPEAYAYHVIGVHLTDQRQFSAARAHYEQALKHFPDDVNLHSAMASLCARDKDLAKAIEHCEAAVRIEPDHAEFHVNLGNVLMQDGQADAAKAKFEDAIRIQVDNAQALHQLGTMYFIDGDLEKAKTYYENALLAKPDYAQAHFNLGNILARQEDWTKAISHLREAIRLQPDHVQARNLLSQIMGQANRRGGGN